MNVFNIGIEKLIDSDEQNSRNNDKQKKITIISTLQNKSASSALCFLSILKSEWYKKYK